MKTIEINLYSFNELSKQAKQQAIEKFRTEDIDFSHIYNEAYETVKEFNDIFGIKEGNRSWLDFSTGHIEDNIMNLKGQRLRTYIINNFGSKLFSRKYFNSWSSEKPIKHRKVKSSKRTGGMYWNVYSGLMLEHSCELTGVCYDESILQPIYEFLEWNLRPDYNSYMDFETLIQDCFNNLRKDLQSEEEYQNSDEAIIETIEANNYTFEEDGTINNG